MRPVSPEEGIAAIFGEKKPPPNKKQSCQRLSNNAKVNVAYNALEGSRALQKLIRATITPLNDDSDPITGVAVECLQFALKRMERCISSLNPANSNTSAKKR